MRLRVLSLSLSVVMILAMALPAFAQTVTVISNGRVDQIIGLANQVGVPPVASGTFQPTVVATDLDSAAIGTSLAPYVSDLDAYFAENFGWRPSQPTTVMLFSNSSALVGTLQALRGGILSSNELSVATSAPAVFTVAAQPSSGINAGEYAILVNTSINAAGQMFNSLFNQYNTSTGLGSLVPGANVSGFAPNGVSFTTLSADELYANGIAMIQQSMARQYGLMMEQDLGSTGSNVPSWFQQGLGDAISYAIVPGVPQEPGTARTVGLYQQTTNLLPTLDQLTAGASVPYAVFQGEGFLGAQSLINSVGTMETASFLSALSGGAPFADQLQSSTGLTLNQLNSDMQSLIPTP